jgi:hypothetical protein
MPATRAAIWGAGSLFLVGLLSQAVGCGPNGVRKVTKVDGTGGTAGGGEETGGGGGTPTGGRMGTGGGTGGDATGGATGGAMMPDASPDVAIDVAPPRPDLAPDLAPDVRPPSPDVMGAPCATSTGAFVSNPFTMQTGTFTVSFDATISATTADTVVGLANAAPTDYTGIAVAVRFNMMGSIDAINGGSMYQAASTISYSANMAYGVRLVVNVANHTYSAYVTPPGGAEQLVGMNYAFRGDQATVPRLNTWTIRTKTPNNGKLCNFAVQ